MNSNCILGMVYWAQYLEINWTKPVITRRKMSLSNSWKIQKLILEQAVSETKIKKKHNHISETSGQCSLGKDLVLDLSSELQTRIPTACWISPVGYLTDFLKSTHPKLKLCLKTDLSPTAEIFQLKLEAGVILNLSFLLIRKYAWWSGSGHATSLTSCIYPLLFNSTGTALFLTLLLFLDHWNTLLTGLSALRNPHTLLHIVTEWSF